MRIYWRASRGSERRFESVRSRTARLLLVDFVPFLTCWTGVRHLFGMERIIYAILLLVLMAMMGIVHSDC